MASPSQRLQTKPAITCLKSILHIYTFIFWITGVVLLTVGVWGKVSLDIYFSLLNESGTKVPYILIGTGAVIVLLGSFGCFATCRGSPWMLKMYAMFLSVIFLVELIAAFVGLLFRHEIKNSFESGYMNALKEYNSTGDAKSQAVDTIQRTLQCCGVKSYTDWGNTSFYKANGIPMSCCSLPGKCTEEDMKDLVKAKDKVFSHGCISLVTTVMESRMGIVAGTSFGISCFQLIGMLLSYCLSRAITNNQYEMM
ncbi:tetraspanin-6 [Spea bombifrons]|uniref:tetraspanin-6 n=1 Tax=Spea bombifrons TaxID=233779 RepID=UPI00234A6505|nr:tetraspanin-6 [Spea bombifrons]